MICLESYVRLVGAASTVDCFLNESDLTYSNVQEQVWTWVNDGDEYFYDKNEWVRVRVEDEQWIDISPSPPSERGHESIAERKSPYSITVSTPPFDNATRSIKQASMSQSGLGPVEWW